MLQAYQKYGKRQSIPGREETFNIEPTGGEYFKNGVARKEKRSNVWNNSKFDYDFQTVHKGSNSIWNFSFNSSFVSEIVDLTVYLNVIAEERKHCCQRKDLAE